MKTILFILFFITFNSYALELKLPSRHASEYLLVAVSGFKTGRDKDERENIFSNKVGKGSEDSGVWSYINRNHSKISKTVYLTHYSNDIEIEKVLALTEDESGGCKEDQGLIMMVNSWGAKTSQKLAELYLKKCQRLPHLTIIIDGVSKPSPLAYSKPILAFNCVNFYQQTSSLKGTSIENCHNNLIEYREGKDLFSAHIFLEWDASKEARNIVEKYLNEEYPVMFVREFYDVNYLKGLRLK